ncbi:hypothetical protein J2Z22_000922 [Paenibacillus forsythiae]|uniref:Uncharacterized protein n=1 Tax=Paenibacillus forsythiae TaxID=365616 RepID=A0ABU3H3V4_9BACL|nr:hypothetical protein [Paenibacillus forsythiae]
MWVLLKDMSDESVLLFLLADLAYLTVMILCLRQK